MSVTPAIMQLEIEVTEQLARYLDALVDTGLFGESREEAAGILIADGVERRMQGPLAQALRDVLERRGPSS